MEDSDRYVDGGSFALSDTFDEDVVEDKSYSLRPQRTMSMLSDPSHVLMFRSNMEIMMTHMSRQMERIQGTTFPLQDSFSGGDVGTAH